MRTAADLPAGVRDLIVGGREAWRERDYEHAEKLLSLALARAREAGTAFGECAALHFLGNVAFNRRRDAEARKLHAAALALSRAGCDDQGIATSMGSLALIDVAEGDLERAAQRFAGAEAAYERAGMREAADSLRRTAHALIVDGTPIDEVVHRPPQAAS